MRNTHTSGGSEPLFELMRDLCHGRIENMAVTAGAPHLTARTKLFRRVRLDQPDVSIERRIDHSNHRPHPQHEKLLSDCRRIGQGVIKKVEVADGLPVYWDST